MKNFSTKLMLLGLTLIATAIYLNLNPVINLHDFEWYAVIAGFIISILGFFVKD